MMHVRIEGPREREGEFRRGTRVFLNDEVVPRLLDVRFQHHWEGGPRVELEIRADVFDFDGQADVRFRIGDRVFVEEKSEDAGEGC